MGAGGMHSGCSGTNVKYAHASSQAHLYSIVLFRSSLPTCPPHRAYRILSVSHVRL